MAYGAEQLRNPAIRVSRLRAAQVIDTVTARRVRRFHAVSEQVADTMALRIRIPRTRIDVVPRGRDLDELGEPSAGRRARARAGLELDDDVQLLLAVGRHQFQKGFDVLLSAFSIVVASDHPRARLLIAGSDGAQSPALREQVGRLGIGAQIAFLGFRDDVPELLCAADGFVSSSRWEGSPGAVLEAMALRTPIVATDIPPIREVLGPELPARLVPVDDAASLAREIVDLLGEGSDRRVVTARARVVDRYSIERVADEMVAFYARALA
jgi:glycosyltransferase involved in cell wall biosynthesis